MNKIKENHQHSEPQVIADEMEKIIITSVRNFRHVLNAYRELQIVINRHSHKSPEVIKECAKQMGADLVEK